MYNSRSTRRHRQVQLYNVCTILACSSRTEESQTYNVCTILACSSRSEVSQTYNICTFEVFSSRAKESKMYIYCTIEVFWLASSRTIFLLLHSAKYNVQSPISALYNQRSACTKHSQAIVREVQPKKISIFGSYNKFNFLHRSRHIRFI